MIVYVYCKCLFSMFHMFFQAMLQVCLSECCICFTPYVASVLFRCCICLQLFFMCFCKCFRLMFWIFQLFCTYVASILFRCFKNRSGVLCMLQCKPSAAIALLLGRGASVDITASAGVQTRGVCPVWVLVLPIVQMCEMNLRRCLVPGMKNFEMSRRMFHRISEGVFGY
jgi:FlaA1/EpsC-like NDP-sugar epimerase